MSIQITIPIAPTGQMRARATVRGRHAMVYKAGEQQSREAALAAYLAPFRPVERLSGPLLLGVRAYLPIPKSKPKKFREAALRGLIAPTIKPDLDNIIKNIKDVMTNLGFWLDDKLIVGYLPGTGKYYSDRPRWEIEVRAWTPEAGTEAA